MKEASVLDLLFALLYGPEASQQNFAVNVDNIGCSLILVGMLPPNAIASVVGTACAQVIMQKIPKCMSRAKKVVFATSHNVLNKQSAVICWQVHFTFGSWLA